MDISVRLEIKKPVVKEEIEKAISSVKGFSYQRSGGPCDLLILEIDEHFEFEGLGSFQASSIFLTSDRVDSGLLIQALKAGIKEFFPQPVKKDDIRDALLKFSEQMCKTKAAEEKKGKLIDVIGSKGGVGTTTAAVNLASALVDLGKQVALVDMNLLFGEVPVLLNMNASFHWGEVVKNISRLDSSYLMGILSKHASGLYVLPSPPELDGFRANGTSAVVDKLLRLMQRLFDFVIVDGGHSLDDTSLKGLEVADSVFLVTELSLPCLTNVKKLLWTFRQLGYPREEDTKVIVTRYHKKSLIQPKDAEESIQKKIHWCIPNDYFAVTSAINQGKTLSAVAHNAEISKSLRELALETVGRRMN
jgi:pilus assembly protein CpaE